MGTEEGRTSVKAGGVSIVESCGEQWREIRGAHGKARHGAVTCVKSIVRHKMRHDTAWSGGERVELCKTEDGGTKKAL